jgi:cytochrome P450
MILLAFHGERMRAYGLLMRSLTRETIAKWPVGKGFGIYPSMRALTFDVIMRVAFGLDESGEVGAAAQAHRAVVRALFGPLRKSVPVTRVPHRPWTMESAGSRGAPQSRDGSCAVRRIRAAAGVIGRLA